DASLLRLHLRAVGAHDDDSDGQARTAAPARGAEARPTGRAEPDAEAGGAGGQSARRVVALQSIEGALALVLARAQPLAAEAVDVAAAAGRVLAEAAVAAVDLPPFPSSAMDGFALRSADTPGTLPVVARVAAGHPSARRLTPGEAIAISTGGVVPEGADAVVPVELVED